MISFELSEEQIVAQSLFEQLATEVVRPAAAQADRERVLKPAVLAALWEAGIYQSLIEGGREDRAPSRLLGCLLLDALGTADTSVALLTSATIGYVQAVMAFGSAQQVSKLRARFGGTVPVAAALLLVEPGFGFDSGAMRTEAVSVADGYRLSGAKAFCPALCDHLIVVARAGSGHSAFLVDVDAPGVSRHASPPAIGLRGLGMTEIRFDDVVLPPEARLGGAASPDIQAMVSAARLGSCAIMTGLARAVFDHILPYTKERVVHGTPLAQKQSVAFRLADMAIDIPAMRWSTWRGAIALEKQRDVTREARLAQLYCTERTFAIADEGVQLMGGHGYMQENPVERWYRDARTLTLLEGVAGI